MSMRLQRRCRDAVPCLFVVVRCRRGFSRAACAMIAPPHRG